MAIGPEQTATPARRVTTDRLGWLLAAVVAVAPRIARMLGSRVWMEDAANLYHGFTLSIGQRPFLDNINGHPPAIEALLALLYRLFGASYRVAETASAVVMIATALLLYSLGRRLGDRWTALAGVAVFSLSPLLFRYHVYEREVFTLALATLTFWLVTRCPTSPRIAIGAGLLAVVAAAVKLSGGFLLLPVVVWFLVERQLAQAVRSVVAALVAGLSIALGLFLAYGVTPAYQLILLQTITGQHVSWSYKLHTTILPELNILLVLGAGGLILGVLRRPRGLPLLVALLAAQLLFFLGTKGSIWPHNLIDLLLPFTLGTVIGLQELVSLARARRLQALPVIVLAVPAALAIALGALQTEAYIRAWGYIPRAQLADAAAFLRAHTASTTRIEAPHYLAAEAQRVMIVDYPEMAGPYIWMLQTLQRDGRAGLHRYTEFGPWMQMSHALYPLWRPMVESAVREHQVGAVVFDRIYPEWAYDLQTDLAAERDTQLFSQSGYRPGDQNGPYEIWLPPAAKPAP